MAEPTDDWTTALNEFRGMLVDLNGDGVPDGTVTTTQPMLAPSLQDDMAIAYRARADRLRGRMGDEPGITEPNYALPAGAVDPFGLAQMIAPDSGLARAQRSDPVGSMIGSFGTAGGAANMLGRLFTAAPRVVATGLGALGITAATPTASEAEDSGDPLAAQVKGDPQLEALYSQLQTARQQATQGVKGVNRQSADEVRRRASEEASRLTQQIVDEIAKRNPPQMPFEKAYPQLSQLLPFVQLGVGAAAGSGLRTAQNMVSRLNIGPWTRAVRRGENALERGAIDTAARNATVAGEFAADYTPPGRLSGLMHQAVPMVGAGAAATEVGLFPHQYNLRNAPEGSPEKEAANRALGTPGGMAETALKALVPGMFGGYSGSHFPLVPAARAPIARSRALSQNVDAAKLSTGASGGQVPPVVQPGERGAVPPEGPAVNVPGRYPTGGPLRDEIRREYRGAVLEEGRPLDPRLTNDVIRAQASENGIQLPNMTKRVSATNTAINDFVQQFGRLPISADEWATYIYRNTGTLAIPAATVGGGVGALMGLYSGAEPTPSY
ncbi:MAG: hypothetical protein AB7O13_24775 [Alphaproteobacteria bacterium]